MNLTLSALTERAPARVPSQQFGSTGVATIVMPGASKPLYKAPVTMRPRTVRVLVSHALDRLAPLGIPNLCSWDVEVLELDDDYQVDFTNQRGATLSVNAISLTTNKCGVSYDFGISASVN